MKQIQFDKNWYFSKNKKSFSLLDCYFKPKSLQIRPRIEIEASFSTELWVLDFCLLWALFILTQGGLFSEHIFNWILKSDKND